jgi:hypothetical protein
MIERTVSQERLHHVCHRLIRFLRQASNYAATAEMASFATSLGNAATGLEATLRDALAAPSDESQPHEDSFTDTLIEAMEADGKYTPSRADTLWLAKMLRRGRRLARHYLAAAEITEPAEEIQIAQTFLDEIDEGPSSKNPRA